MKRFIRRFYRKQGGFTLIELLVVIAILGILAAIIVPSVSKYIGSGQTAANDTEKTMVQNAVFAAMADAKLAILGPDTALPTGVTVSTPLAINNTSTGDITITVVKGTVTKTYTVSSYFSGGDLSKLVQSYDVADDGTVTIAAPPASP